MIIDYGVSQYTVDQRLPDYEPGLRKRSAVAAEHMSHPTGQASCCPGRMKEYPPKLDSDLPGRHG